ncbi:hypothetical protein JCM10207_001064 [Rhodosporidiobolus poonsookiae]
MISSLGTALLDEFAWLNTEGDPVRPGEVRWGGGGTYAIIGARVWTSKTGIIVRRGPDFPAHLAAQMASFGDIWQYQETVEPTPRALNTFVPPSPTRHFRYTAPPTPITAHELAQHPILRHTQVLHLCCTPQHFLEAVVPSLSAFPASPLLVYEPIPFACTPAALPQLAYVFPRLHLFSPNHEEAGAILGFSSERMEEDGAVEEVASAFRRYGAGNIVIRSGARGAFVLAKGADAGMWVEPFHRDASAVKDTVGAGNSFLGGTMAGFLAFPDDLVKATQYGSVSAGIVVEGTDLPYLTIREDGVELWNGKSAQARLEEMLERR